MKNRLRMLVQLALSKQASDIHLVEKTDGFFLSLRKDGNLISLQQDLISASMIDYLRFISGMDLCRPHEPQSGKISLSIHGQPLELRCSFLENGPLRTCTLRLLHNTRLLHLQDLTSQPGAVLLLEEICSFDQGLVICCGPTGAGKTTTIHAMLQQILKSGGRKIVTLEDPVEISQPGLLQLNAGNGSLSYERGIEELMRHDPDVIFLGECRSEYCAAMAVRAALTGHLVFTTLHAGNGEECLHRLLDLKVKLSDLQVVSRAFLCQKLVCSDTHGGRRKSHYEIWKGQDLIRLLHHHSSDPSLSWKTGRNTESGSLPQSGSVHVIHQRRKNRKDCRNDQRKKSQRKRNKE